MTPKRSKRTSTQRPTAALALLLVFSFEGMIQANRDLVPFKIKSFVTVCLGKMTIELENAKSSRVLS